MWRHIERSIVDVPEVTEKDGVTTILSLSPYDVPHAMFFDYDPISNDVTIKYRYLGQGEIVTKKVHLGFGVRILAGKFIPRVYEIVMHKTSISDWQIAVIFEKLDELHPKCKRANLACKRAFVHFGGKS